MMSTNKVLLLCRLGGDFIWESNKVYYKGGTNRMVHVDRAINFLNLLCKVRGICKLTDISSIQYKYPGLDLDSLVSIENDDDVSLMIGAFPQSNEPVQLFVYCAQNPSIPIATPSNLMQDVDTRNAQVLSQDLHEGYKAVASSSHNANVNSYDVPSASNDLHDRVNNMQKVMPILKEGQEFEDVNAFHKALREYAIRSNFQYKRTRSGGGRFQAKCIKNDCLWCIHACKLPDKPTFKIKSLKGNHTCNAANESTISNIKTHRQASRKWIATLVKDRLQKNLPCTPKDIVDEISREYKITVSYDKAWRGKELALKEMHFELSVPDLRMLCKDIETTNPDLSMLCKDIETTNPGSTAKLSRSSDNSLRLFIAYKAAICGFKKACRPVVRLERMKTEGEYPGGEWFFAMAIDANSTNFPVSYAFVESESIESWKWFCGELNGVLGYISGLTFISDRQEGILEEVSGFFPDACHRYHYENLCYEIWENFECDDLLNLFKSATFAPFHSEFDDCMSQIQAKYKEAWNFIKDINPKHWAASHFEGKSYGYCTYSRFSWFYLLNMCQRSLPITQRLLDVHNDISGLFARGLEKSSEWKTIFVPIVQYVNSEVEKNLERYNVTGSAPEFEVVKGEGAFKVDIERGACSCLFFQRKFEPCEHVMAAILYSGCNVYDRIDYLTVAKYRETYSEVIHPLTIFEPELMKKRKYVHQPTANRYKQDVGDDEIDVLHPMNRGWIFHTAWALYLLPRAGVRC